MSQDEHSYHYQVMARAIENIDGLGQHASLDDLARSVDMSPAHFQRLFSKWAGVSPKRFQQYLTLGYAKSLLKDRFSTLDAAHGAGLSGAGRLHDLFVRWEAMSPGDYAKGGEGLTIHWNWYDSPFGPALIMATDRGICGIGFGADQGDDQTFADMSARWPKARYVQGGGDLGTWAQAAFRCDPNDPVPVYLIGAPFQIKVWEALMQIPSGHVTTYSAIADAIGHPSANRAVGTAVGQNPVSFLIPCHRALRKSGGIGGYHWGVPVKRAILAWEGARMDHGADFGGNLPAGNLFEL